MSEGIKETVKAKYGQAAIRAPDGERATCGGSAGACGCDPVSSNLYDAGALEETEYMELLAEAGFVEVGVEPTRVYQFEDARAVLAGRIMGAFVRARKPA